MLYRNINFLAEIAGLLYCIHCWYEEKFSLNFGMVIVICMDVLTCELVNECSLPDWITAAVYAALALYCFHQFDIPIKAHFINMIMAIMCVCFFQLAALIPSVIFNIQITVDNTASIFYNLGVFGLLIIFEKKIGFGRIKQYVIQHNWLTYVLMIIYGSGVVYWLIQYRIAGSISEMGYVWLAVFCSIMCAAWYGWMKEKETAREKDLDLKMYELYCASFEELLQQIREKQHDFKNHMQAVYNCRYLCNSYEDLVEMQEEYCGELLGDNHISGLLNCGNAILAGFLYGKFSEAERQNVSIEYEVRVNKDTFSAPYYVIVETIGILWDNALEAVAGREEKKIGLLVIETEDGLDVEVTNEIGAITIPEFMVYFEKGRSTKGTGRGIGLWKIKKYGKKYNWSIVVDIFEKMGKRYLKIRISL